MQSSSNIGYTNKSGQSFLDKFKGKTNKIGKQGFNNLLQRQYRSNNINQNQTSIILRQIIVDSRQKQYKLKNDQHLRKIDLDQIIPSYPKSRHSETLMKKNQRTPGKIIKPQKQQYVPSFYTPSKNNIQVSNSLPYQYNKKLLIPPPSHSISQITQSFSEKGKSKYTFGKYIKLDENALRHFQFLQQIQKKIIMNKQVNGSKVFSR